MFICFTIIKEISKKSKALYLTGKADKPILFWLGKKSQIIAMGAISDTEKIGASADKITRSVVTIQTKADALRAKITEKTNDPSATEEELSAAASASLFLDEIDNRCKQVISKADAVSSQLYRHSNNMNDFINSMDACLSNLDADQSGVKGNQRG
jgi:hypothetical protein